jgi:hypothetical protein
MATVDVDSNVLPKRDQFRLSLRPCATSWTFTSAESVDFRNKMLSAWVLIEPGTPGSVTEIRCRFFANAVDGAKLIYLNPVQGADIVRPAQWTQIAAMLTEPAAVTTNYLSLVCTMPSSARWRGSIYIDDIIVR